MYVNNDGDKMEKWLFKLSAAFGVLLPLFAVSSIFFYLLKTIFPLELVFVALLIISVLVNLYFVEYLGGKRNFNPRKFKVSSVEKEKSSSLWITVIAIYTAILGGLVIIPSGVELYAPYGLLVLSFLITISLSLLQEEELIYLLVSIKAKYRNLYIATTSDGIKIFIISNEKVQANIEFDAYSVVDDLFLYGYRAS